MCIEYVPWGANVVPYTISHRLDLAAVMVE